MKKRNVKRGLMSGVVLLVALCLFTGCGDKDQQIYQDVLERYVVAIDEGWDTDTLLSSDMSYLYALDNNAKENMGYALYDVDGNGEPELLIGKVSPGDYYKGMLYDMYTVVDNVVVSVLSGGEKNRYYLCEDNRIELAFSGGDEYKYNMYYELDGVTGKLKAREAIIYDGEYAKDSPWFYTFGSLEPSEYSVTTEREAKEIMDSYIHKGFEVTPFSQYK